MSPGTEQRKLAAIMFTDMVGYSALAQRNEALALELLEEHRRVVRGLLPRHGGREVKTTGDGFLLEFPSALAAVQGAVEIQNALHERNQVSPPERQFRIRIGIHVGDVVMRDGDIHGDGVNIAARIEPLAAAGGICISSAVHEQVRNKLAQPMTTLGPAELKNIELPVVVHRVTMPWETPGSSRSRSAGSAATKFGWIAALLLFAIGIGWWLFHPPGQATKQAANPLTNAPGSPAAAATPSATDQKSIAVLPFVNLSADKADEYLSDGMTEELLNVLAQVPGLRVPGRSSSFAFKGRTEDNIFRKVGEQLHVTTVLEGSVRKAGDKLRITAQLINVADGFQLWSDTYDRDMTNIFAIQSDIAARVAEALKVQLLGAVAPQKKPTENLEAYKLYLQGRQLWNRRTIESVQQAVEYFNQAIGKDPGYALAYAGLADCYVVLPNYAGLPPREAAPKARAAALKALELDSSLAEPHAALASFKASFDWDWQGAEAGFRRAIALNPNYATGHQWLAVFVLGPLGRFDEALGELQKAQELDPLSPIFNVDVAEFLGVVGQPDLGIRVLQKQIAIDPSLLVARGILGAVYYSVGNLPEAVTQLETMRRLDGGGAYRLDYLGFIYARAGRTNEARTLLGQLQELQRLGFDHRVGIAQIQHGLGDDEGALASLELALDEKAALMLPFNYRAWWKDLRPHPRAQAILKRMNLVK